MDTRKTSKAKGLKGTFLDNPEQKMLSRQLRDSQIPAYPDNRISHPFLFSKGGVTCFVASLNSSTHRISGFIRRKSRLKNLWVISCYRKIPAGAFGKMVLYAYDVYRTYFWHDFRFIRVFARYR